MTIADLTWFGISSGLKPGYLVLIEFLLGLTGFLMSSTWFGGCNEKYINLDGSFCLKWRFTKFSAGICHVYRVLLGFTGFYWVLLGFGWVPPDSGVNCRSIVPVPAECLTPRASLRLGDPPDPTKKKGAWPLFSFFFFKKKRVDAPVTHSKNLKKNLKNQKMNFSLFFN